MHPPTECIALQHGAVAPEELWCARYGSRCNGRRASRIAYRLLRRSDGSGGPCLAGAN
ncbi:hypothetical protein ZHAS_00003676 [Anopheles sinensis]|uniref:Uncharacterized protein n=1 Tax=Anopheles sinensis TaxID=74873 RepID=A0A084VEX8_ANOSI|nr:hypothetical protein ZHAS_00003676 [Anopheles sinensis]